MSVFNILTLAVGGYVQFFSQSIGGSSLILTSYYACMLIPFFSRVFAAMSTWVNLLVTLDRVVCITTESRLKEALKNKKNLNRVVLVMFGIILALNLPSVFFYLDAQTLFDSRKNTTFTQIVCVSSSLISELRDGLIISMRIVIPIILQIVMSSILIYRLFHARTSVTTPRIYEKDRRFAFTIVWLNVVYILGEVPLAVINILINIYGYNQSYISTKSNESAVVNFLAVCIYGYSLLVGFSSLLFVNYAANHKFQKETKKMIGCF